MTEPKKLLLDQKLTLLSYNGRFKFETIELLLKQVKEKMDELEIEKIIKKKIFNIMVELIENIYKYTDWLEEYEALDTKYSPKIQLEMLEEKSEKLFIITGENPIRNPYIKSLQDKIDMVNNSDEKKLKKMYTTIIEGGSIHEKGGAGLGLIDIALKSNSKLHYNFTPINGEISSYQLQIKFKALVS